MEKDNPKLGNVVDKDGGNDNDNNSNRGDERHDEEHGDSDVDINIITAAAEEMIHEMENDIIDNGVNDQQSS